MSILPVDQGIEHFRRSPASRKIPTISTVENIVKLAVEGGLQRRGPPLSACLGSVARKYAHKIPFIVKINHNELLTMPNKFDPDFFSAP